MILVHGAPLLVVRGCVQGTVSHPGGAQMHALALRPHEDDQVENSVAVQGWGRTSVPRVWAAGGITHDLLVAP
jgi:thioredoxin reductase